MPMQVTALAGATNQNGIRLAVKVLSGAAAVQNGPTATQSAAFGSPAAHRATLTTTVTGSLVYGAILSEGSGSVTAQAGTTVAQYNDGTNGATYADCRTTAVTGTPGSVTVGASAPSSGGGCAIAEILPDGTLTEDPSAPAAVTSEIGKTVTTASFTPPAGTLLVAMVSAGGSGGLLETMAVSGGGLNWTPLAEAHVVSADYAGVFIAVVPADGGDDPLITITETGGTANGLLARMVVLTGAAARTAQTGATATQTGAAAHQASITTTQTGSIVYGALANGTQSSYTAAAGTTLSDNFADTTNGNQYGSCRAAAATGTPGAATVGASAPTALGSTALAEILPVTPGGTITVDGSSPAVSTTMTTITVQVNVTPPAGSLLVLMISSDGGTGSAVNMSVAGGGLTWTARAESHASGQMYAGVWIADIPVNAPPPPARPGKTWRRRFKHKQQPQLPAGPGAVTVDSTGSSPAGAGAVTALATQDAGTLTTAAGAASVTAAATVIAGASAAGAAAVTAKAVQIAPATAAGAGAAATVPATQQAIATAAGAGSASDVATQIAAATAAGAGAAPAQAIQAAGGSAAGAGAVADVVTQIAPATAAGAGSVTAAGSVSGASTASVAGAGSVTAVVTQIAPASAAGAGAATAAATQAAQASGAGAGSAGPAPATQIAPAASAGAGAVSDVATQIAIASAAGAGSVTAAGSVTGAGSTATAAGAGSVTAVATQIAPATAAGAGSIADVATQIAKATAAGAGSATAAGQITGTANVAGAGAATARAAQAAVAQAAGAAVLSALAAQRATAAITGAGSATAAGGVQVAFTIGVLSGSDAPTSTFTGQLTHNGLTAATAARTALTAADQRTGGPS